MKLSFPKFGKADKSTDDQALAALKARLSTPEGCEQAHAEALAKVQSLKETHPTAAAHYRRQAEELQRAIDQHRLAGWRNAAAQAVAASLDEAKKLQAAAGQALVLANDELQAAEQRVEAIDSRLEPLVQQQAAARAAAAQQVEQALASFNRAMSEGDEPAQAKASQALFEARRPTRDAGGPIALRIDALKAQRTDLQAAALAAKTTRDRAAADLHKACAALLYVEFDQAANVALEAYIAAEVATRKALGLPPGFKRADTPILQFSQQSHAVFGSRMDAYSNRTTPSYAVQEKILRAGDLRYDLLLESEPTEPASQGEYVGLVKDEPPTEGPECLNELDAQASDDAADDSSDEQQFYRETGSEAQGARG